MIDETQIIKEIRKLAAEAERGRRRALRPRNGNWPDLIAALAYKVRYDNCKDILGIIDRYASVDDKGVEMSDKLFKEHHKKLSAHHLRLIEKLNSEWKIF